MRDLKTHAVTSLAFEAGYGAWEDNISRQNPERLELIVQALPEGNLLDQAMDAIDRSDLNALLALADHAAQPPSPGDGKLHVGQHAQVTVRSPFAGQLLLSIETDGILSTQVLDMPANHIAVPIEITESCRPNAYVTATVLRPIDPNVAWTVHRATGVTRLAVDNSDRKLNIQLAAPREIRPETSLDVQLRVLDAAGVPVPNAAVTLAAVDEGICRLTHFETPDPFAFFTSKRALGVQGADIFGQLMPEVAKTDKQSAVGGDDSGAFNLRRGSPVHARRVQPVALVSASCTRMPRVLLIWFPHAAIHRPTARDGRGLRRRCFRLGRSAGAGPIAPLLVQSSWPRFAAPSDRFTVPLTIFNNSAADGEVNVTVQLARSRQPVAIRRPTIPSISCFPP